MTVGPGGVVTSASAQAAAAGPASDPWQDPRLQSLTSREREVFERDGILLAVSEFTRPRDGETARREWVRYRTVGDLTITPERLEIEDRFGNRIEQGVIGVVNNPEAGRYRTETYPPLQAVWLGVQETGYVISRTGGYLARLLYLAAMIGFFYFLTQYLQNVLGFSAFEAGIAFFPMTVVNFIVALFITRITQRWGQALPLAFGVALTMAGMFGLAQITPHSSYWTAVAAPMLLVGIGQGLAFAPLTSVGIAGVDADDAGAA